MVSGRLWSDLETLLRLDWLFTLLTLAASGGTRIVERRRASLADTGRTTPSAFRPRRENFGAAAADIQLSSGLRDVLGCGGAACGNCACG